MKGFTNILGISYLWTKILSKEEYDLVKDYHNGTSITITKQDGVFEDPYYDLVINSQLEKEKFQEIKTLLNDV